MGIPLRIPVSDFSRRFEQVRETVYEAGVIEVTSHDRVVGAYISPEELEHFNRLKRREVQVLHVGDIDDGLLTEIENAEYGVVQSDTAATASALTSSRVQDRPGFQP